MKSRLMAKILICGIVVLGMAVAGSCAELPMIKVGHVGHDHQLALYVAAEAGKSLEKYYGVYLKELKPQEVYELYEDGSAVARVHLVKVGGGSRMPAAMSEGHIEVGLGGLGPVTKFIDKGSSFKVLAPLNNDGDALIMRNGINASSWNDFVEYVKGSERPVRVGYKAPMAVAYMILGRALKEEGISYGQEPMGRDGKPVQVITVDLHGLKNALPSLEAGIVDGVVVNEPMASTLEVKGVGVRVADLSTLPPEGKWKGHPCCIVAATEKTLEEKRNIVVTLLKVIAAGGDLMTRDINKAFEAEAAWTKTPQGVGRQSIPNVSYVVSPDAAWVRGVDTWFELMITSGHFKKVLKGKNTDEIRETVLELGPMNEALSGIKLKGGS